MRHSGYPILRAGLLLLLIAVSSQHIRAAMYKWTDEEGNTHYTQEPPPGGIEGEIIKPPPKVKPDALEDEISKQQKFLEESQKDREKIRDDKSKQEEEIARKQADCDNARKRLESYQRPRVNAVNEDGSRSRVTEEDRQSEIIKIQKYLDENCG